MKNFILICTIFCLLSGCGQDFNSQTNDKTEYTTTNLDTSTPEGLRLNSAYSVLQKNCFSCHGNWATYDTSANWVNEGLISAGDYSSSKIISILKNYGGRMPPSPRSNLTDAEIAALQDWILNL